MFKKVVRFLYCQKIDLHSDILSLKEIQTAIKQVVETHEDQFIKQLKEGQYNPKLWIKIKHQYIHPEDAVKILKTIGSHYQHSTSDLINKTQTNQELIKNDIYNYFIKYFSKRYDKLTFGQIATILEQYAYVRRFDQEFFRTMENEIFDRLSDKNEVVRYQDVEKILWAYQYCHAGSAILYGQLAQIIKIAQHEINPLKLAYYSYLYSKCPDNQKGGFGVYALTEKQTLQRIRDYTFPDFVKLAKYIFTQNICSNDFQVKIEEQLAEQFPPNKNLQPSDLVKLCKSTINYYYKYNDKSLYHKIEGACIDLIDQVNEKQFCQIFWSFLKSRKGNAELYAKFLEQLKYRQNMFSIRQLAILYLNSSNNPETFEITKLLNEIICKKVDWGKTEIKPTYLAYITIASMQAKLPFALKLTSDHLKSLSIPMKLAILQTLQLSLPNLIQIQLSVLTIQDLQEQNLDYEDMIILRYSEQYFYKFCSILRTELKPAIHKQLFYQVFYLDPTNEHYHNQLLMLLQQYKDEMRFFFKQDHWVVISWCLLQEHILNQERLIKKELIDEACMGIKELDINTIFNVEKYIQSLWMTILLEKLKIEIGVERVQQFIKVQDYATTTVLLNNYKDKELLQIKSLLQKALETQCSEVNLSYEYCQSYINMFDQDIGIMLPVAYLIKTKTQDLKFGLIILEQKDFSIIFDKGEKIQEKLGQQDFQTVKQIRKEIQITKLIFEQLCNWNVEYLYIDDFRGYSVEQQLDYLQNIFALSPIGEEDVDDELRQNKRKPMKFADKLALKNNQQKYNIEIDQFNRILEQDDQ